MVPVNRITNSDSRIEGRMHNEHVIGLWKPRATPFAAALTSIE